MEFVFSVWLAGAELECIKFFMSQVIYINNTAFQVVIKMWFCYNYCATNWRKNCTEEGGSILDFDTVWILSQFGFHCILDFIRIWILLPCKYCRSFNFTKFLISSQFVF